MDSENTIPPQVDSQQQPIVQQTKRSSLFLIVAVLTLVTIVGLGGYYLGTRQSKISTQSFISPTTMITIPTQTQAKGCTMEAKICPDGTSVGRTELNCEFAPCPTTNKAVEEKFTGTITDINYQCHADGICTIQMGAKFVIVGKGESLTPEPKGNSSNIELDENKKNSYLGKKVEVFAQKIDNNTYTIYGKTKYYVKLLNQKSEDGKFCGGFAGIECPVGYLCKYDGNYPDASGTCVKK